MVVFGAASGCSSGAQDVSGTAEDGSTDGRSEGEIGPLAETTDTPNEVTAKPPPCGSEPIAKCAAPLHIASAADVVSVVKKLPWQSSSRSFPRVLTVSGDLVTDADIEVDASMIAPLPDCSPTGLSACHAPLFREYAFPNAAAPFVGVTCKVVADNPNWCTKIAIAKGTTFRLRAIVDDHHPSTPQFWPFIEFARSCATPCTADETRCEATQTCFARGFAACAYCEGKPADLCACRDACKPKADGATCTYDPSSDVTATGKCSAGTCKKT
ncbi:MAG: hypothetical protein NVS3B20_11490 [Polyangiales bacterium]